jgi:hypothetical protein
MVQKGIFLHPGVISCLLHNIGNYTSPAAPAAPVLKKKSKLLISQLKITHLNRISTLNGILAHIWFEVCEDWGVLVLLASSF